MTNVLSGLALGADVQGKEEKDSLGGGVLNTNVYDFKIDMAYTGLSGGGARFIAAHFKDANGAILRIKEYISSGNAKGNKITYTKDGVDYPMPGYTKMNGLCLLAAGKEIHQLDIESKKIKLYDHTAGKEVPTDVDVLVELIDQEIKAGVLKQTVDKTSKNDATGKYEPTGETREENEVDKFFSADNDMTVAEIKAQATEATFMTDWKAKWEGKVKNKSKGGSAGTTADAPANSGAPVTNSLFKK